jgi:hypothetical protein
MMKQWGKFYVVQVVVHNMQMTLRVCIMAIVENWVYSHETNCNYKGSWHM